MINAALVVAILFWANSMAIAHSKVEIVQTDFYGQIVAIPLIGVELIIA
jgi:hypothetical protein